MCVFYCIGVLKQLDTWQNLRGNEKRGWAMFHLVRHDTSLLILNLTIS